MVPYQRLLESPAIDKEAKVTMRKEYENLKSGQANAEDNQASGQAFYL